MSERGKISFYQLEILKKNIKLEKYFSIKKFIGNNHYSKSRGGQAPPASPSDTHCCSGYAAECHFFVLADFLLLFG